MPQALERVWDYSLQQLGVEQLADLGLSPEHRRSYNYWVPFCLCHLYAALTISENAW